MANFNPGSIRSVNAKTVSVLAIEAKDSTIVVDNTQPAKILLSANATATNVNSLNSKTGVLTLSAADGTVTVDNSTPGVIKLSAPAGATGDADPVYKSARALAIPLYGFTPPLSPVQSTTQLQSALDTYGYVALEANNVGPGAGGLPGEYDGGAQSYQVTNSILLRKFGGLKGVNSTINFNAGAQSFAWQPVVSFKTATFDAGVGNDAADHMHLEGLVIYGGRTNTGYYDAAATNPTVVGVDLAGRNTQGNWDIGNSKVHLENISVASAYIGINHKVMQYARTQDTTIANCAIGNLHSTSPYYGGGIDMPNMTRHFARGCGICHAFSADGYPFFGSYRIDGAWAKGAFVNTGFAFFYTPTSNQGEADFANVIIDGGTLEYGESGGYGENATAPYLIPTINRIAGPSGNIQNSDSIGSTGSFLLNVPKVDVWVQKWYRVVFNDYEFQTNGQRISFMLDGPGATAVLRHSTFGELCKYIVRARDARASTEVHGLLRDFGGIIENVREWPTGVMCRRPSTPASPVLCGFGGSEAVTRAADFPRALHASFNPLLPAWTNKTSNVTEGTATDSETGETVSYFEFGTGAVSATSMAITPFLGGFGSAASYSGSQYAGVGIELKNTTGTVVRVSAHLRAGGVYQRGCNPVPELSPRGVSVAEAVSLWPGEWMRVFIGAAINFDVQLAFACYNPTGSATRILTKNLGYIVCKENQKARFDKMLNRGLFHAS